MTSRVMLGSAALALVAGLTAGFAPPGGAAGAARAAVTSISVVATDPVPDRSRAYGPARAREVVERRVIGRSAQGRRIVAFRKGNPDAQRTVLVLGQMHGDEPAGLRTARAIRDRLRVDSDADLWIVPTTNPDGAARGSRQNARGVDLNRNWPTSGWRSADADPGSRYYRGRRPGSEPETQALMRFLRRVQPDLVASVHQPLRAVGKDAGGRAFQRRLSRRLDLPIRPLGVGTPGREVSPTMTGWYNARHRGTAITVEYGASPSRAYVGGRAAHGLLHALLAHW